MKKILIIGGAGFIGYHLANKLTGRFKIDLIDNFSRGRKDKELTELVKKKNVKLLNLDFLKKNGKVKKIPNDYFYIFHLAAIVGVRNVIKSPYEVLTKNLMLLQNAIEIGLKQKKLKRFIFSSSSEVYYGTLKNYGLKFPTKESTKLSTLDLSDKRGAYMLSKIYGEAMCMLSGLPFIILRPHNFYGPRMGQSHVIPEILRKVYFLKTNSVPVFSPNHRRNFCYIEDGINLILSLISKKKSIKNTFNIGSDKKDITIKNLVNLIIKISKKKIKIKAEKNIFDSPKRRLPDVSKAMNLTNYKHRYTLEQGLKETLKWYEKNVFKNKRILNIYN